MSQVSYGTITITDTNDIARVYVVYAKSTTNTDAPTAAASTWTESIANAPGSGDYIWQRTVTEQSGTHEKAYGNPVCVTGPQGGTGATGRGVSSIVTTYCNYGEGTPVASYAGWQSTVPTYDSSKPNYWVKTVITYTTGSPATDTSIYKDNGITDAIYNSAVANSIAQSANENSQGALSQSEEALQTAIRVDTLLDGHFIYGGALSQSTPGGVRVIEQVKEGTTDVSENPGKWHHNVTIGSNGIQLRYNELVMAQLKMDTTNGSALTFYSPSVSTQGNKLMELTGNALNFYNTSGTLTSSFGNSITLASNGATITIGSTGSGKANTYIDSNGLQLRVAITAYATLNSNGLTLSKGGIEAGTIGSNGGLYISTIDKAGITVNGHTPGTNDAKWRAIIGSKFGVDSEGNLYANGAIISGTITVGSGSNVYTKTEADSEFDANGAAATAQTNAINAAATDATNKANAAQSAAEATAAADATSKANAAETNAKGYTDTKTADMATNTTVANTYATKTTAIYRSQRIYYRKTISGAPNKNETWLATSGTGYGNWSLNIPQLTHTENNVDVKYPYLYTAVQIQTVTQYNSSATTNNCSCSDVLLDDTTTVIDGGSIIAGSVTANEITGNTLSAIYADLGAITAGSISRGNNSINFNQDAATLEFKNASTWTNATKGIQWTGSDLNIKGNITATSLTLGSGVQIPASTGISGLSTVATSGSYNDLDNKPTIPSLTGYIYVDGTVGTTPADGATGFVVSSSGLLTASNAVIYGSIYASKGYIGGWQIGTDGNKTLHNGNANTSPIPGSGVIILSKGIAGPTTATGVLPANQTWAITASNQFGVTTAGKLYATGADISGKITVGSGSDLSAGLTNYSTTSQMNTAIGNATNDMATNAKTDWLVEVTTTGIPDFVTPSVTLKAIVYHRGVLTTSGFTRAWYKNGTGNSLGGEETVTVSDMDAYYVCIISETN